MWVQKTEHRIIYFHLLFWLVKYINFEYIKETIDEYKCDLIIHYDNVDEINNKLLEVYK